MAHTRHQYALSSYLARRAAELGSTDACLFLARLFGFGVLRANPRMSLFERDTPRGVAWALVALDNSLQPRSPGSDAQDDLLTVDQTLVLLCSLLCAPEVAALAVPGNKAADMAMGTLLAFPRRHDLFESYDAQEHATPELGQGDLAQDTIWARLSQAISRVDRLLQPREQDDSVDTEDVDQRRASIDVHAAFLRAYALTRDAFETQRTVLMERALEAWTYFLRHTESRTEGKPSDSQRMRRVATEGQQWALLGADPSYQKDSLSKAEAFALFRRIARVFPYYIERHPRPEHEPLSRADAMPPPQPRLQSMGRRSSTASTSSKASTRSFAPRPGLASMNSMPVAAAAPSTGAVYASGSGSTRYSGSTSSKLRALRGNNPSSGSLRRDTSKGPSTEPQPRSYLDELDGENHDFSRPGLRRRTSSIVSVTPSLMFPGQRGAKPAEMEQAPTLAPGVISKTQAQSARAPTSTQDLQARLRRQASFASLKKPLQQHNRDS